MFKEMTTKKKIIIGIIILVVVIAIIVFFYKRKKKKIALEEKESKNITKDAPVEKRNRIVPEEDQAVVKSVPEPALSVKEVVPEVVKEPAKPAAPAPVQAQAKSSSIPPEFQVAT